MSTVNILPGGNLGRNFIPAEYLPAGKDEYYLRIEQAAAPDGRWRHLHAGEIEKLVKNSNTSDNWDDILVTDEFEPDLLKNNEFFGFIRIGRVQNFALEHHDFQVPVGITNSTIVSCDIGDDVAIHDVRYLAHYIIGDRCILVNIDEMHATNYAKFGNGIIKDGEPDKIRVWLDIMNETGSRQVLPFDGMITADAYMWGKFRNDTAMIAKLKDITQSSFDSRRGFYGQIGSQCVIKSCRIIKDVKIGSHSYIKGANKLKNLTINSDEDEPTQVGEGVELVNGIVGFGCHIFYGCKAVKFILGNNANLKYGARLINSFLGDNSTISCCEVLNNLIFPAHEQHHNNSFLIASVVMGQSNMAAGATVGSNHNSRANDNEIQAGRGFWSGLCTSVKHSCRFASFVLLSKADYPAELNIMLPFSLLSNDAAQDQLEVMPAFWWMYNMYALARNSWKFVDRDKRKKKIQNIEFDPFAPDTIEEVLIARELLEIWTAKASLRKSGQLDGQTNDALAATGRELLKDKKNLTGLTVFGENMEKSSRKAVILKPYEAYNAYGEMLIYYAVKNLTAYMNGKNCSFSQMAEKLGNSCHREWVNLGGQLIPAADFEQISSDIKSGKLSNWQQIHQRYAELWSEYPLEKQKHAFMIFKALTRKDTPAIQDWFSVLDKSAAIQDYISQQVYISRKKDFENPFRQLTYRSIEEMTAAIGTIEDNSFVKQVRKETQNFKETLEEIKKRN